MASVGDIWSRDNSIFKYVSASEDFSTYSNGLTTFAELSWDEPRPLRHMLLNAYRPTALANGAASAMYVQFKRNHKGADFTKDWSNFYYMTQNNATPVAGSTTTGFSWTNINKVANGSAVAFSYHSRPNLLEPSVPVIAFGIRMVVNRNAADTTLAGVWEDIYMGAVFE
jgi:hypothetical protein